MDSESLRIPKKLQAVALWIHPEGKVIGSIYRHLQSSAHDGPEQPQEILNQPDPFLILKCDAPDEVRFYNKRCVIRVQYRDELSDWSSPLATSDWRAHTAECSATPGNLVTIGCWLHMMDGSILSGVIRECVPPAHRRLFDYINNNAEAFIKLYLESGDICLVNKRYIVRVNPD